MSSKLEEFNECPTFDILDNDFFKSHIDGLEAKNDELASIFFDINSKFSTLRFKFFKSTDFDGHKNYLRNKDEDLYKKYNKAYEDGKNMTILH